MFERIHRSWKVLLNDLILLIRTILREHIPKRWGNLEEPIKNDKVFDDTKPRINGQTKD